MTDIEINGLLSDVETLMNALSTGEPGKLQSIVGEHFSAGGSRVRARLALEAGMTLGLSPSISVAIASGCELLHNASLVHDDLQDRDALRRNAPSLWAAHGENTAICAGDLMLSAAYAALAQAGPHATQLIRHAHQRVADVIAGQCEDLRLGGHCADPQAYERVAAAKSGPLLALPIELALMAAGMASKLDAARSAATLFALAYQMLDDLADADRDAANGSLNAVAVHATFGTADPRETVRRKAMERLAAFELAALDLPAGIAQTLMLRARKIKLALAAELEPA